VISVPRRGWQGSAGQVLRAGSAQVRLGPGGLERDGIRVDSNIGRRPRRKRA